MPKTLKKLLITLAVIAVLLIVALLTYTAVNAFSRGDVAISDSDFVSRDGNITLSVRGNSALILTEGNAARYACKSVDRNLYELTNADETIYMIFVNDYMIYFESTKMYLYNVKELGE